MIQNRRTFLRALGAGSTLLVTSRATAQPGRPRLLEGGSPDVAAGVDSPELGRAVAALRVGDVKRHDALVVAFLHGDLGPTLSIATLDEARARGQIVITERGQASVPELIVDNRLSQHVLLLAGEILSGGKQNRVVTEDILLPPRSGERALGVYCVEQGRWDGSRGGFRASGTLAGSGVRSRVMAKSGQGSVWSAVREYASSARASSPTGSYTAVVESPAVDQRRAEVERVIDGRAPAGSVGVAVFHGATLLGLDAFADASLFARQWPKLLRAAIVDSLVAPAAAAPEEPKLRERVATLLRSAAGQRGARHTNAGVGTIFEARSGNHVTVVLAFEGRAVHLAVV